MKAALKGLPWAQCNLGTIYADGIGVRRDEGHALHWFRASAERGDDKGQYNLALAYLEGKVVRKNSRLAKYWLRKAAKSGHRKAKSMLKEN